MEYVLKSTHMHPCVWGAEAVQEECGAMLGMDPILILPTVYVPCL